MKASVEEMRKGLSDAEKDQLAKDMMAVVFSEVNLLQAGQAPELFQQQMRDRLNGKTREEISQLAIDARKKADDRAEESRKAAEERLREEKEKQLAQIQGEIEELVTAEKKAVSDAESLRKFEVKRSRFYLAEGRFSSDPTIELTVRNGTSAAISRVYFEGVLSSPGRSVPWVKDRFNYQIPGGLEPGEEVTWKLQPNMFGEWSKAPKDRTDCVLTVKTLKLDGADEKTMLDSEFPEHQAKRLQQLRESLEEIQAP